MYNWKQSKGPEAILKLNPEHVDFQIELLKTQYKFYSRKFDFKKQGLTMTALQYLETRRKLKNSLAEMKKVRQLLLKSKKKSGSK